MSSLVARPAKFGWALFGAVLLVAFMAVVGFFALGRNSPRPVAILDVSEATTFTLWAGVPLEVYESHAGGLSADDYNRLRDLNAERFKVIRGEEVNYFHKPPVHLEDEEQATLQKILAGGGCITMLPGGDQKKCSFHADFCVEWNDDGPTRTGMYCSTCREFHWGTPSDPKWNIFDKADLTIEAAESLNQLVEKYNKLASPIVAAPTD